MATETLSTLDGFHKRVFAKDGVGRIIPEFARFQRDFPFLRNPLMGDEYQKPVQVKRSFGWTWAGRDTPLAGTAFTLNAAVPGQLAPARAKACEFVDRVQIPYGVITKALTSEAAFGDAMGLIIMTMDESAAFAQELSIMYAGTHIGQVNADPGGGPGDRAIRITDATYAQGIWAQAEGMPIDIYDSTLTTLRNTASGDVSVKSFDGTSDGITLTGTEASLDAIEINDVILPAGAKAEWSTASCAGIKKILENTGTLYNVSASTYGAWKSTVYAAGSVAATLALFNRAAASATGRGGMGKFRFYVSHFTWTDLNVDHSALRKTDEKEARDLVLGSESIRYFGPSGEIEIVPHPMMFAGEAWGLRMDSWSRPGSIEYTHELPASSQERPRFYTELADKAGFELRGMCDYTWAFCSAPNRQVQITGIVNNATLT